MFHHESQKVCCARFTNNEYHFSTPHVQFGIGQYPGASGVERIPICLKSITHFKLYSVSSLFQSSRIHSQRRLNPSYFKRQLNSMRRARASAMLVTFIGLHNRSPEH
jgi:hypothetical protein